MREFLPPDRSINQHNYDPSVYAGVAEMYLSGMSIPKIASKFKMYNSRIWKYLNREGIPRRPKRERLQKYDEVAQMRVAGLTMAEIGRKTGFSLRNIQSALITRGIPTSNRKSNPTLIEHRRPRMIVAAALGDGRLQRQSCEACGSKKSEAHHDDYNRPLDVRWLCRKHHFEWHKSNSPIAFVKEVV